MPHAVILIAERDRDHFDRFGILYLPTESLPIVRRCKGFRVVLYQSARTSSNAKSTVGYFATAVVDKITFHPHDEAVGIVHLKETISVAKPKRMVMDGFVEEAALRTTSDGFKGWTAAQAVREISTEQLIELTGHEDDQAAFVVELEPAPLPRFASHPRRIRDPKFHDLVYRAYGGRCAISGVTLVSPDNICGLVAAHIYPHAVEAFNFAAAGILLAPTWHDRFDTGSILIYGDYHWSAVVEDSDTEVVQHRRLLVPSNAHERPNVELLRRKRALFGHP